MQRTWLRWCLLCLSLIGACKDASSGDAGSMAKAKRMCGSASSSAVCVVGTLEKSGPGDEPAADTLVSPLGQPVMLVTSDDDGSFVVLVDPQINPVTTGGTKAEKSKEPSQDTDYTLLLDDTAAHDGRALSIDLAMATSDRASGDGSDGASVLDLGTVKLLPAGNLRGKVTLAGQKDHTGIHVYLPGTSYAATTAADGQFMMSNVPPGVYPFLRAEKDGYNFAIVAAVDVPSADTLTLDPLTLGIDTGAKGTVSFGAVAMDAEGAYSTDATVLIDLVATDDAVLVMISEDKDFAGASWQPIETQVSYTFEGDGKHTVYVKFADANGLESSPVNATITIDTDPKVQVLTPDTTTTQSLPTIDWTDTRVTGATYRLQVARDMAFTDVAVDEKGLTESSFTLADEPLVADKTYHARVVIEDGKSRSWSDVSTFRVDFGSVMLVAPQGAQPSSRPVLDWSEPLLPGASYHVQLADDSSFTSPLLDETGLSTSQFAVQQTLTPGKTYYFRVAVQDAHGVEAAFSSARQFSVDLGTVSIQSLAPSQPDSTPTLYWSASGLPSATYHVQVAKDAAFTLLVDDASDLSSAQLTTSVLENGKSYYIRVAVVDTFGAQGSWAGPTMFDVSVGSVGLALPADDALTGDTTPTLSWNANAVATSYVLTYGTDAGLSGATDVSGITDTQHTLTSALPDTALTTYYWAVTPVDVNGVAGTRSPIRSFRLDTQAPTGTLVINGGDLTTYDEVVQATLTGSDSSGPVEVMVNMTDSGPSGSWLVTSNPITLDYSSLASTNTATITAYGYMRDAAGNVSSKLTATIDLARTLIPATTISSDTTWAAAQNPFYVTGDVVIQHPATLTLGAGATVYFKTGKKLDVRSGGHAGEAGLYAGGSSGSPITLHGARIDLNYATDWVNDGRAANYDIGGNYLKGPYFDYVTMTDGRIHVRISTFDGPGFYMRHSSLGTLSADFFGYVLVSYIEHSTITSFGDGSALNLDGSQVLNSHVGSMSLDGYTYATGVKIEHCDIDTLVIDRWVPANNSLQYNELGTLTWNRPSTTNSAALHNNNFVGVGALLTLGADTGSTGLDVDATGNYWGAAATAEMQANQQNITAIHDFHDDSELMSVDFSGYLTTPVVGAGPDW